ncbi:MAG: hypothetical protein AAF591_08045 [Verrucomicrobiota bacterium]
MTAPRPTHSPEPTSLATRFVESAYGLLAKTSGYNAWRHFQALQRNQWLSRDELDAMRWKKFQNLLDHAENSIPFYQKRWRDADVQPSQFTSIDDIKELPVVTKQDLIAGQQNDEFNLSRRNDFEMTHTSGTTGPCMYLPFTKHDLQVKYAAYLREFYATDWRLGMPSAAMHYSGHPEFAGKYTGKPDRDNFVLTRKLAFRWAHRRILLTPYFHTESGNDTLPAQWYQALKKHRPFLLETMDFSLVTLFNYIQNNDLPPLSIPRIFVLSTLSPKFKARLESAFSAEIFDRYGPHEIEGVAYACHKHVGMHIAIDCVHVEFLDEANHSVDQGDSGHLVLTDFHSRVMPLIRYKIGDIGSCIPEPCSCGMSFPLINEIHGRTRDRFELSDQSLTPPIHLISIVQDEPAVRLFQLDQQPDGHIIANVIPDDKLWSPSVQERLTTNLAAALPGGSKDFSLATTNKVPLEHNGKFTYAKRSS